MPQGRLKEPRHCQEHSFTAENPGEWGMHKRWYHGENPKPWPPKQTRRPHGAPQSHGQTERLDDHERIPIPPAPAAAWTFQWRPAHTTRRGAIETTIHGLRDRRDAEAFLREDIAQGLEILILAGSPVHA